MANANKEINILKIGGSRNPFGDFYHFLMKMPWWLYFVLFCACYLVINSLFASIYYIAGDSITNSTGSYWEAFVFSFQTSSTIGYGQFMPKTVFAHLIVLFDAMSGILFVALATGLAFAKFSRPTARVLFTKNILITSFEGKRTLMFRIANSRKSQIIDARVNLVMSRQEETSEGTPIRKMYDLQLVRRHSPLFSLSWTVMHVIDELSPLYSYSEESLVSSDLNFIVSLTGIEDVFSQSIYDRHIYYSEEIEFNKRFADLMQKKKGKSEMDLRKFHQLESF